MCLIALAWRTHPRYELALIANRDEFHGRPAAPAAAHPLAGDVYGGRDLAPGLEPGGSWLLASSRGRLAAVTNVRVGRAGEAAPRSRGTLVRDFAVGAMAGDAFLASLEPAAGDYGRFNLLLWDGATLAFGSNHPRFIAHRVTPGVHAMSNGALDAAWPKSGHATRALASWLSGDAAGDGDGPASLAPLFDALADTAPAPDATLPDTGVGLELERALSPPFVLGEHYGTRCSTVVLVDAEAITVVERRFGPRAQALGESSATLRRPA